MPSGDVLVLVDEDGRVVEWGHTAEELFGWSAEQAVGRPVADLLRERREHLTDTAALQVTPVLDGTSLMWQIRKAPHTMPQQDIAVLDAMFTQTPVGLHVLDDQLRVVRMSSGGPQDTPSHHLLGRHFTEAFELHDPDAEAAVARGVLETGRPVVGRLVPSTSVRGRPGRRIYSVSFVRLEDPHGQVLGVMATAIDVTERERAQQRLALLDTVRTQVGHRLNVISVCQELAEAVVPAFAGIAVIEVVDDVVRGEEPPSVPVPPDAPLRRAAFQGLISANPVGDVRPLPAHTPFAQVLTDLEPRLVPIDESSTWLGADPARADAITRSHAHSLIVAPLALRDHALGIVSFYRHHEEDPFEEEDIAIASALCAHAALCMENARQYMREWIIASTVQHRLLPRQPAPQTTVDICQLHLPGPQGGSTWADAIALPGARTALIIGDVTGGDITAAITMGLLRTATHTLAAMDLQPDELLARLSDTTTQLASAYAALPPADPQHHGPLTAGCTIAIYDPVELTCTVARAGLAKPIAIHPDNTITALPVPSGPLLADPSNAPYPATTVHLPEGTTLAFTTAPLTHPLLTPTDTPLPDNPAVTPLPRLRDALHEALTDTGHPDEILLLLARTRSLPASQVLTLPLPHSPEAAPLARRATRRQLKAWNIDDDTAYTTQLIVSELVSNAIRYGTPPHHLRLIHDQELTCEVTDTATSTPHITHARTIDETGRGLYIVATLADQWGARHHKHGKTVWTQQTTIHTPPPPA